ncbi:MAG: hypothetical protein WBV94_18545 [Blastocatellia bacterium]
MWKVILPDKQEHEFPDDIAGDDDTLRDALVSFVPEIKNADLKRTTTGGVQTVTVIKKAGTKGGAFCQRCKSTRMAEISAKCSDRFGIYLGGLQLGDTYVPDDLGIGGNNDVEFGYCLNCGQIAGQWPLEKTEIECQADFSRRGAFLLTIALRSKWQSLQVH